MKADSNWVGFFVFEGNFKFFAAANWVSFVGRALPARNAWCPNE